MSPKGAQAEGHAETRASSVPNPSIEVWPPHQVLHKPSSIHLSIYDPSGDLEHHFFSVRYNGYDVTSSFLGQAKIKFHHKQRRIEMDNAFVRLPASEDHQIEFFYESSNGGAALLNYEEPVCYALRPQTILRTEGFDPPSSLIQQIENSSKQEGFNAAFVSSLIAEESGFNPRLVSWAKAIGLTQVTHTAEAEVASAFPDWPRYENISNLSVASLKLMIMSGAIYEGNEWRLNPQKSVIGGVHYTRILAEKWSSAANLAKIAKIFANSELAHSELILASYHSGYSRVQRALDLYGQDWIHSPDLTEARKYVRRVFSYCSAFSQGGPNDPST